MPFIVVLSLMAFCYYLAWRPDGSFVRATKSCSGSQVLVQSRPVVALSTADKITSTALPLLETHKKHCVKVIGESENEAPIYTLPRNIPGNQALFHALEDYHKASSMCLFGSTTKKVVSNSFSLLVSLYGGGNTPGSPVTDACRVEAVSTWLRSFVASDMIEAITAAQSSGDNFGAIFTALSGGDSERASSLALAAGCPRLSLMLANSSMRAQPFYENQLAMWHDTGAQQYTPTSILRICSIASGSIDIERQMFRTYNASYDIDWRRRFGIYLWSCSHSQNQSTVSSVVNQYVSDVTAGLAPPAKPLYCEDNAVPTKECMLYQILNHYGKVDIPLAGIIDPLSHTPFAHDFSSTFHLCATMSALVDCNLNIHQEGLITDSLASQLIGDGLWEWAVYVCLCSVGSKGVVRSSSAARMIRAKNIIMRFYSPSTDPIAESRCSFLQDIGIPSQWLAEARAYRLASEGDIFGMLESLMQCSASASMAVLERLIIPHMILEGKNSRSQLWQLLESLRSKITENSVIDWDKPNGCGVFHQLLDLEATVEDLSRMQPGELQMSDVDIDHLLELATDLEAMISTGSETRAHNATLPFTKVGYGFRRTPPNVVNAEVGNMMTGLRMHLMAIKTGKSLNYKSQMALSCPSQLSSSLKPDGLYADSLIRGLCGFEPIS